ncbi:hypothetical protein KAT24_02400 [Candidatus Pacearchaeota archaeon]|nr:hypothetical protein [Candidatus Pacearchaeota archaeon]
MSVLEQVSQMKSQGIAEQDIISRLKQQKISPKDINDALSQSKIKEAVYSPQETNRVPAEQIPMPENTEAAYVPRTQEITQEANIPQPQETYAPQEEYAPPQEVYQQEAYGYPAPEEHGSDMMIEISEQVFNEKIRKVEKQIDKMNDVQVLLQTKTEYAVERLKRIESIMDKLQVAILERIGSYGKNLETIKKEMEMIEDSFTKIVPSAKRPAHKKLAHKKVHTKTPKKKSKTQKK